MMMNKIRSYFQAVVLILALIAPGCRKDDKEDAHLTSIKWVLEHLSDNSTGADISFPQDAHDSISVEFSASSGEMLFNGICNNGSGSYSLSHRHELRIRDIKTTLIACPHVEWESYVIGSLIEARSYEINGNELVIFSDGDYDLYFRRE